MTAQLESRERREVIATARRYRRDGYKVSGPDQWRDMPSFLGDIVPDLIAEREDDKVVIEIKDAAAVRGSNDMVELATRVAEQPGWRFELIALRSIDDALRPDLLWGRESVEKLIEQDFLKQAFIVTFAMVENVILSAASRRRPRSSVSSPAELLKDLLVKGIVSETIYDDVREARRKRNALMHDLHEPEPSKADVHALMDLGSALEHTVLERDAPADAAAV